MSDFGSELRRLRVAKGFSQKGLGDAIGLTQSSISHMEEGGTTVSGPTLFKLSHALDVSVEHFRRFLIETKDLKPVKKSKRGRPEKR